MSELGNREAEIQEPVSGAVSAAAPGAGMASGTASEPMSAEKPAPERGAEGGVKARARSRPPVSFGIYGAVSALYALFYTFCLYRNASGITYPFFAAGTLFCLFYCMKKYRVPSGSGDGQAAEGYTRQEKTETAFYAASILLLGISVFLTDDWKLRGLTKTGLFLLTVTLALRCFWRTAGWSFGEYLAGICRSLLETLSRLDTPFSDAWEHFREKGGMVRNRNLRLVLVGLAASLPVLCLVAALLVSADEVFRKLVRDMIMDWDLVTPVLVCLMIAAVYTLFYSFLRGLTTYQPSGGKKREKKGEPVAAVAFTSLFALLYLVFCVIQVNALLLRRLPEGMVWSQYARQGFFQLLFVCLINLVLVLGCLAYFKENRILKGILTAISLMTYCMIASSACRMILYIYFYHLTFLRVLVLWALAVLALLFAGVIVSIYQKRFPLFGYCTAVVTVFYIGLAFARPDYWIAKYDMAHARTAEQPADGQPAETYEDGTARYTFEDYYYLAGLSADAAPVLFSEEAMEKWGERPAMTIYYDKVKRKTEKMGVRSFNFSRWRARRSMEASGYELGSHG